MFHSQELVQHKLGGTQVEPDHMLVGLLFEPDCMANQALVHLKIDPKEVVSRVVSHQPTIQSPDKRDITLSASGKRLVDSAYNEAISVKDRYMDTGHLLLGILHVGEGFGVQILSEAGASIPAVRNALAELKAAGYDKG